MSKHSRHSHRSDDGDDDDGKWYDSYFPDDYEKTNSSITTSVTIHITPNKFSGLSWVLLWIGFAMAIGLGTYQVFREYQWMTEQRRRILNFNSDLEQGSNTPITASQAHGSGSASGSSHPQNQPNQNQSRAGGRQSHSRGSGGGSGGSSSSSGVGGGGGAATGDGEMITSADMTRSLVGQKKDHLAWCRG
jgi:uncharacterized membrane protein YgcG